MEHEVYRKENVRLTLFYGVFGLFMFILASGLVYRQIIKYSEYKEEQTQQNYRRILMPGPRGNIYDRDGRLLVGNRPVFSAVVFLNELRPEFREEYIALVRKAREEGRDYNSSELAVQARRNVVQRYMNIVNGITGLDETVDPKDIERHRAVRLLLPFTLVYDLELEHYAQLIEQLPIDSAVQITTDSARYYPYGKAAAHVLGYVINREEQGSGKAVPNPDLMTFSQKGKVGKSGLERAFEDRLRGTAGGEIWVVDPSGFQYERTERVPPQKGEDITTSLDIDLQRVLEDAMPGKTGAAAALDIETGEVLAMASMPNYDLNDFSPFLSYKTHNAISERGAWLNRAVAGLYPPGSTFKLITSISGLQNDVIGPDTEIYCPGYYMVGRRRFRCHRHSGHGMETLEHAIRDSCNVFYYDTGQHLGVDNITATARMFGLDQPTGVQLPEETSRMLVPDPAWKKERFYDNWYPGDTANLSIGQGYLLLTPLQMASFTASLARDETRTQPTLLKVESGAPEQPGQHIPLPGPELDRIHEGMRLAGSEGTAKLATPSNATVAGKTGTAQVRIEGRPSTLAWFIGYAPVENPQIAIAVMIEGVEAGDSYHGGSTAAPIARAVFEKYFEKQNAGEAELAQR